MSKNIEKLNDEELSYYLATAKQFNESDALNKLVELDPRNPLLKEVRTVYYRLRQESVLRTVDELASDFKNKFSSLKYEELTADELFLVIPEFPPAPEEEGVDAEVDFVGKDDPPRPVEPAGGGFGENYNEV